MTDAERKIFEDALTAMKKTGADLSEVAEDARKRLDAAQSPQPEILHLNFTEAKEAYSYSLTHPGGKYLRVQFERHNAKVTIHVFERDESLRGKGRLAADDDGYAVYSEEFLGIGPAEVAVWGIAHMGTGRKSTSVFGSVDEAREAVTHLSALVELVNGECAEEARKRLEEVHHFARGSRRATMHQKFAYWDSVSLRQDQATECAEKAEKETQIVYKVAILRDGKYGSQWVSPYVSHYQTYEKGKVSPRAFVYGTLDYAKNLPTCKDEVILECVGRNVRPAAYTDYMDDVDAVAKAWHDGQIDEYGRIVADVTPTGVVYDRKDGNRLDHDPVFNPAPKVETEASKLARLDPDTMTKHPELWEPGDYVEARSIPMLRYRIACLWHHCEPYVSFTKDGGSPHRLRSIGSAARRCRIGRW